MERLTTRHDGYPALAQGYEEKFTERSLFFMLLNRLAAYEDTELEPEEIVSVQEEPWCVFYFNRRCNLDGDFCPEGPGCPHEMSPEDALLLLKLAQAEKDGQMAVLPCKIGDPVWWITLSWVEKTVTVRYTIESGKFRYGMLDWKNPIYTSREAAEAALTEMANGGGQK